MPIDSLDDDATEEQPHGDAVHAADDPDAVVDDVDRRTPVEPAASQLALQDYWEKK